MTLAFFDTIKSIIIPVRFLACRRADCFILFVNQILASDALLEALPQRTIDLTFILPLEPDSGVIASEHVQGIAVSENTVFRFLAHKVELHAILLEVFNDQCVTLVVNQL